MEHSIHASVTPTEEAFTYTFNTDTVARPACLSAIAPSGATYEISIEIPTNTTPEDDTDTDWTALTDEYGSAVTLSSSGANAQAIPCGLLIRVKKAATAGSAVGLRWS